MAHAVFRRVDPALTLRWLAADGARVEAGQTLGVVAGSARSILVGERVALNFMQRMSGIATLTRQLVDAVEVRRRLFSEAGGGPPRRHRGLEQGETWRLSSAADRAGPSSGAWMLPRRNLGSLRALAAWLGSSNSGLWAPASLTHIYTYIFTSSPAAGHAGHDPGHAEDRAGAAAAGQVGGAHRRRRQPPHGALRHGHGQG